MKSQKNSALLSQVKRSSRRTALDIAILGFLITTTVAIYIYSLNQNYLKNQFIDAAQFRVDRVTEKLRFDIDELNDIKRFFEASNDINQAEFSYFSSAVVNKFNFRMVAYAELTYPNELGNTVPKKLQNNKLINLDKDKKSFFLIKTIEPFSKFSHLIDWDISSHEFIQHSIDSSLFDNSIFISNPPQSNFQDSLTNFRYVIAPVYKNILDGSSPDNKRLSGVLFAVYPIDSNMRARSLLAQPRGLNLTLYEVDSKGVMRKIYHLAPLTGNGDVVEQPDLVYVSEFDIAGKLFKFEVKPNGHFIEKNSSLSFIYILIIGYLASLLVSFYLYRYLIGKRFKKIISEIAEESRNRHLAILREYIDSSGDMIALKTTRGGFILFNKLFADFASGVDPESLPQPDELKINPELISHLEIHDDQISPDSDLVHYRFEFNGFVYDMRKFPVILDDDEMFIGMIIRDITPEIKRVNEILEYSNKLEANNRTKNKFFSIIAHDLKSPFLGILGFLEIILDEFDEIADPEKKELLSKILVSTQNIYELLDQLLDWSRTQTDRIPIQPENFLLKEIDDLISGLYRPLADKKNILLENKISEYLSVFADKNMVKTIFRNLVSNAIKFTNPGGKITLEAHFDPNGHRNSDHQVVFSVADNGVGIKKETMDKIFKLDEKTVSFGTQNEKGTGLGLILCKEFVEKNGGTIWIESTPGEGSTFFFTLPVSKNVEVLL